MAKHHIEATVNGDAVEFLCETEETLLDVLRDTLHLTGSKEGCGSGDCGACSVIVDGRLVCACLMLAPEAPGRDIVTIEGIANGGGLHPIQQALVDLNGTQCGFCTPGIVLSAKALLDANPAPTKPDIRHAIAGNLCRCTGYGKIVEAIAAAAATTRGQ
jgi:carbon-monoxide dehydrogenase small subunit